MRYLVLLSCLVISSEAALDLSNPLKFQFSSLDFQWPNASSRLNDVLKGYYIPGASVPVDLHVQYLSGTSARVFLTMPRQGPGRPFTLAVIGRRALDNSTVLLPYPDYSWHANQGSNCQGLTSVFRVWGDECNRLWVVDTGRIGNDIVCPPQILAFDLNTDQLLVRHVIPQRLLRDRTILVSIIADVQSAANSCQDTFVYVTDSPVGGLIVFDLKNNKSWKIENKLFYPWPSFGTHTIAGQSFDLMGGILGLALHPREPFSPAETLYFHSFASNTENTVLTKYIKNGTLFDNNFNAIPKKFKQLCGTRKTQAISQDFDKAGRLYFQQYDPPSILRWDSDDPYGVFEVLEVDDTQLQFCSGIKIITGLDGNDYLWVMSTRYQKYMTGTLNPNEINFRIFSAAIDYA